MNVIIPQAPEVHHETIQPPPEYVGDYQEPPHLEGVSHTHHRWSNGRSHGGSSVTTSTLHTPPPVPIIEHKEPVTVTHVHEKPPLTVRVPVTHLHQVTYATP